LEDKRMGYLTANEKGAVCMEVIEAINRRGLRRPPKELVVKAAAAVKAADPRLKNNPKAALVPMVAWLLEQYPKNPW
jgi:hypothetical protein